MYASGPVYHYCTPHSFIDIKSPSRLHGSCLARVYVYRMEQREDATDGNKRYTTGHQALHSTDFSHPKGEAQRDSEDQIGTSRQLFAVVGNEDQLYLTSYSSIHPTAAKNYSRDTPRLAI